MPYDPDWVTTAHAAPAAGQPGRDRGVQWQPGVLHPEAVRPDQPHAAGPGRGHRLGLQFRALIAGFGEARAEHYRRGHGLARGGPDDARDGGGRGGDHGQVHRAGDVTQAGVGGLAADLAGLADRHHLAGERGQVVPQQPPHRAGPVGRPDQGDPARLEHGGEAAVASQHAQPGPCWGVNARASSAAANSDLRTPSGSAERTAASSAVDGGATGRRSPAYLQAEAGGRADLGHGHVGEDLHQPGLAVRVIEHTQLGDQPLRAAAGEAELGPGAEPGAVAHVGDEVTLGHQGAPGAVPGGPHGQLADGGGQVAAAAPAAQLHLRAPAGPIAVTLVLPYPSICPPDRNIRSTSPRMAASKNSSNRMLYAAPRFRLASLLVGGMNGGSGLIAYIAPSTSVMSGAWVRRATCMATWAHGLPNPWNTVSARPDGAGQRHHEPLVDGEGHGATPASS